MIIIKDETELTNIINNLEIVRDRLYAIKEMQKWDIVKNIIFKLQGFKMLPFNKAIASRNKIQVIKILQDKTGLNLLDAKNMVEAFWSELR